MRKEYRLIVAAACCVFGFTVVMSSHIMALITVKHMAFFRALIEAMKSFFNSFGGSVVSISPYGFLGFFISSRRKRDYCPGLFLEKDKRFFCNV